MAKKSGCRVFRRSAQNKTLISDTAKELSVLPNAKSSSAFGLECFLNKTSQPYNEIIGESGLNLLGLLIPHWICPISD